MKSKSLLGVLATLPLALAAQAAHAGAHIRIGEQAPLHGGPPAGDVSSMAASVIYSGSALVSGSSSKMVTLQLPSAGELFLTLTDYDFTSPFASLSLGLMSGQSMLSQLSLPGSVMYSDTTGPLTLYADVSWAAQGALNAGLYNVTATFLPAVAAVPLPESGLLLISALGGGLLLNLRCRRRQGSVRDRAQMEPALS